MDGAPYAVNHHGGRHAGDAKQALHPQDGSTVPVEQHGQPACKGCPSQRLVVAAMSAREKTGRDSRHAGMLPNDPQRLLG
jgi:hypothetical protein